MKISDIGLVVVTGAGSGIGRATVLRFAKLGATVIALDIDEAMALETVALVTENGGVAHARVLDVADSAAFEKVAALIKDEFGVPDVVVNNAGICRVGSFLDHSPQDWQRVLGVDLSGVVYGSLLFGAQMSERGGGGHIVNIASLAAWTPARWASSYCAAKAGVRMLSESLRAELASENIGVTAVCPGAINTSIYSSPHLGDGGREELGAADRASAAVARAARMGLWSPPDLVARAIVRSVKHDVAVVPVRPEAWLSYELSRAAPGVLRTIARHLTYDRLTALSRRMA